MRTLLTVLLSAAVLAAPARSQNAHIAGVETGLFCPVAGQQHIVRTLGCVRYQ